jgi:hypothetical protein
LSSDGEEVSMSRADAVARTEKSRSAIAISMLILLSAFVGLSTLPTATALVTGNLAISEEISPIADRYYTSYGALELAVKIENLDTGISPARILEWYVCEGEKIASQCMSNSEDEGQDTIPSMAVGEVRDHVFSGDGFVKWGANGIHTVLYRFTEGDSQGGNDLLIYKFNLTTQFVDFDIDEQYPLSDIDHLAQYGDDKVLNANTDYNLTITFDFNSCGTCSIDATIGWQLYSPDGLTLHSQANHTIAMASTIGVEKQLSDQLPTFTHDSEGRYNLKFGLLNSSGSTDMVSSNNLVSVDIVLDNTIDLVVDSMYPQHDPTSSNFYYGNQSLQATFSNDGNISIYEPDVVFLIDWLNGTNAETQYCEIAVMHPGESHTCIFDINTYGDVAVQMSIQEIFDIGSDAKSSDNRISQSATVIAGDISPHILQSNANGLYFSGNEITLEATTSPLAAKPVTFQWRHSALAVLGNGQIIAVNGTVFGNMGDFIITLYATDALGNTESASTGISLLNSTDIGNEPYFTGTAITRTNAYAQSYFDYPILNGKYGAGGNLSALRLMSFDVLPSDGESNLGLEFIDMEVNLSMIIPQNVPFDSVIVRKLDAMNQTTWQEFGEDDSFTLVDNDTMLIHLIEPANLFFVGILPPPEVSPGNLNLTLLPAGQLRLDWQPTGDLDNPYFGQWNIYRITGSPVSGLYFPEPTGTTSAFTWGALLENTKIATVSPTTSSWTDPTFLEEGVCASYALIPTDRTGLLDISSGVVSHDEEGNTGLACGDAVVPQSQVVNLTALTTFDNSTSCHMKYNDWYACYQVTLTWTFPENEQDGNISWNLYRLDAQPNEMDLRFIEPVISGMDNIPGDVATYIDNGSEYNGVRPYRTYYYVLAPMDVIGNEATETDYPGSNVIRVHIDDEHWDFNSWRIPEPEPEPEPPMGSPWLGGLFEQMDNQVFQIAGMTMLGIIVTNFIGIPLLLLKNKKLKMKIKKKKGIIDDDDDLEDDLAEFFN